MIGWWRAGREKHQQWLEQVLVGDREIQQLEDMARRQARESKQS